MVKRLLLLVVLILIPFVSASAIGISPAKFQIYFEPNLEKNFTFKASNSDAERVNEIYVRGDLAEYVTLSKDSFRGFEAFTATLKLPEKIDVPGKHRILIGVRELDNGDVVGGIGGLAAVQAPIDVLVPYPGRYVEADFHVNNVNKGENADFTLKVHNLGTESVIFRPKIEVYEGEKLIETVFFKSDAVNSKELIIIEGEINSSDYKSGFYKILVTIDYGEIIKLDDQFRVGELFVNITDYSHRFKAGQVNDFWMEIESLWNHRMRKVYGEITITDEGETISEIRPGFVDLDHFEKKNLTSFFDAKEVREGKYIANLKVYYEGESNHRLVNIYVEGEPKSHLWTIIGGTATFFIIIIFIIIIYLVVLIRKLKKVNKYVPNKKYGKKKK